jgi:hypothetical protein
LGTSGQQREEWRECGIVLRFFDGEARAIGIKERNRVRIGRKEFEL